MIRKMLLQYILRRTRRITLSQLLHSNVRSRSLIADYKRNSPNMHFFKKAGLLDPNRRISFDEFHDLAAEFWDSRDHFRMVNKSIDASENEDEGEDVDEVIVVEKEAQVPGA